MANLWDAEVNVTVEDATRMIEEQFSELTPVSIEEMGEGFDNKVFLVNDKYVFRFPRREKAVSLLEMELALLPELVEVLPISIPNPLFRGEATDTSLWPFAGYTFLRGRTTHLLNESQRKASAPLLSRFLKELHQFPVERARRLGVPEDELGRLSMAKRIPTLEENVERLIAQGLWSDRTPYINLIRSVQNLGDVIGDTLVHGDLHIRNLLVNDEGIVSGIIDWGDAHIGNRAIDLSVVYSLLTPPGRKEFFNDYGAVDETTHLLARFKAIYTSTYLLLHAFDQKNEVEMKAATETIHVAFM